ncbi:MAG: Gfo/Idh/MocA family oxidoreductase [Eubacteriales bacterium]|nr:Gfo/Idh/MocA family oxidoreductase [Eubacteriales bacterium]
MKSAIVGCGGISRVHAQVLSQAECTELVACADIRPERAQARAEEYGAKAYTDYIEMLDREQPDVLHICTPHALHVPMAVEALRRGVHVFMEKPVAVSAEQFAQLAEAAKASTARLGICFQNRFNPTTQEMKAILADEATGKPVGARAFVTWHREAPYYVDSGWRGTQELEGGSALINQSIHTMDLLVHLLGKPVEIEATATNRHLKGVIETEDTLEAYIRFAGGATAIFYATTAYAVDSPVLFEVACEQRLIRFEGDDITVREQDGSSHTSTLGNDAAIGKSYWGSGHGACIGAFYEAIRTGAPFMNDLDSVRDTMALTFAAYASARTGKPVKL